MVVLNNGEIDRLIEEDVPYFDLTTFILGIEGQGEISFSPRHPIVVCGTEECRTIFERAGLTTLDFTPSGREAEQGEIFLRATGDAKAIHRVWKVTQNLLEYACGIATRSRELVRLAKGVNPKVELVTTRKSFPLSKKISVKAVISGGALPHRLGLSETVLIFQEHIKFLGGIERLIRELPSIKARVPEKKVTVEVKSVDEAFRLLKAGVDVVQLDKLSVEEVREVVRFRNEKAPASKVAAAGGINRENIELYASTGVDIIVLSYPYFGKPADIKVRIEPC